MEVEGSSRGGDSRECIKTEVGGVNSGEMREVRNMIEVSSCVVVGIQDIPIASSWMRLELHCITAPYLE